jgi:hypothetical protein
VGVATKAHKQQKSHKLRLMSRLMNSPSARFSRDCWRCDNGYDGCQVGLEGRCAILVVALHRQSSLASASVVVSLISSPFEASLVRRRLRPPPDVGVLY